MPLKPSFCQAFQLLSISPSDKLQIVSAGENDKFEAVASQSSPRSAQSRPLSAPAASSSVAATGSQSDSRLPSHRSEEKAEVGDSASPPIAGASTSQADHTDLSGEDTCLLTYKPNIALNKSFSNTITLFLYAIQWSYLHCSEHPYMSSIKQRIFHAVYIDGLRTSSFQVLCLTWRADQRSVAGSQRFDGAPRRRPSTAGPSSSLATAVVHPGMPSPSRLSKVGTDNSLLLRTLSIAGGHSRAGSVAGWESLEGFENEMSELTSEASNLLNMPFGLRPIPASALPTLRGR